MKVVANGDPLELADGSSVEDLLAILGLGGR